MQINKSSPGVLRAGIDGSCSRAWLAPIPHFPGTDGAGEGAEHPWHPQVTPSLSPGQKGMRGMEPALFGAQLGFPLLHPRLQGQDKHLLQ